MRLRGWRRHSHFSVCDLPKGRFPPAPRCEEYTLLRHALPPPRLAPRSTPIRHRQHLSPHATVPFGLVSAPLCPETGRGAAGNGLHAQQPGDARSGEFPGRLAVVKLEVLLLGGCVYSPHGPDGLSSTYKKSLREIADFKEPKSAPAGGI